MITTPNYTGTKGMNIGLWAAQILLALMFGMFGVMKMGQSLDQLAVMMKWVPSFPAWFVRTLGALEFLGAIGLILPSLTRIMPRMTVVAAGCFLTLQVFAVCLHLSRGEASVLGLNAVLIALIVYVLWGRTKKSVITTK